MYILKFSSCQPQNLTALTCKCLSVYVGQESGYGLAGGPTGGLHILTETPVLYAELGPGLLPDSLVAPGRPQALRAPDWRHLTLCHCNLSVLGLLTT